MIKKIIFLLSLIISQSSFATLVPKSNHTTTVETKVIYSKIHYIDKKAFYTVDISVPTITTNKSTKLLDKTIHAKVNQVLENFKSGLTSPEELQKLHDSNPNAPTLDAKNNTLDIHYDIVSILNDIVSIRFKVMSFYYMQAHPNNTVFTINYDLNQNKSLSLSDLFKDKPNFLELIADYCKKQLENSAIAQYSDPAWITKGTAANEKNYDNWSLTPKGLLFTFDTYQVAAYVAGQPTILIPYNELINKMGMHPIS
ncbi:MAG: RsiV family protein [Gammaproteobacteria bacterium]